MLRALHIQKWVQFVGDELLIFLRGKFRCLLFTSDSFCRKRIYICTVQPAPRAIVVDMLVQCNMKLWVECERRYWQGEALHDGMRGVMCVYVCVVCVYVCVCGVCVSVCVCVCVVRVCVVCVFCVCVVCVCVVCVFCVCVLVFVCVCVVCVFCVCVLVFVCVCVVCVFCVCVCGVCVFCVWCVVCVCVCGKGTFKYPPTKHPFQSDDPQHYQHLFAVCLHLQSHSLSHSVAHLRLSVISAVH